MDREAWLATVHGVSKGRKQLSARAHTHTHTHNQAAQYVNLEDCNMI